MEININTDHFYTSYIFWNVPRNDGKNYES